MTATTESPFPFADLGLARRLERAEGRCSADMAETRARLSPASGAGWVEVAGAYVIYDGVQSPLTQTFCLGLFQAATRAHLEVIEEFFRTRGAPVFHEVSPLADPALPALLSERRYHPVEFTNVMFRPLRDGPPWAPPPNPAIQVRLAGENDYELWAQTAAKGWGELTELGGSMLELARVSARRPGGLSFLAEREGQAVATGALTLCDGVAFLAGASTVPEARNQGAQRALLDGRLRHAAAHSCDLAMMGAQPGSASQRNAERQGFRIAYTRIKWQLVPP
jgi:hypothetical protein